MKIISRYILRAHIPPFIFGFSTVVFLFLLQFLMKYLDKLVGKGLDNWVILQLILLNIAWMAVLAVPMGVLFSTLMGFGSMAAAQEITIIKAGGSGLFKMMRPSIAMGVLMCLGLFYFNDAILPETNHRAKVLMSDIQRKKPTFAIEPGRFSTEIEGYAILARNVDSISGLLRGLTIYDVNRINSKNIINADSGTLNFNNDYSKLILHLKHGEIHQLMPDKVNNYKIIHFDNYRIAMNAGGFDFQRSREDMISRGDRELHISDMKKLVKEAMDNSYAAEKRINKIIDKHFEYISTGNLAAARENMEPFTSPADDKPTDRKASLERTAEHANYIAQAVRSASSMIKESRERAGGYEVEINKKYAIPFACLLFVFVGCPLGILTKRGNFGISAAISLGFYIFYWACLIGGEKLADRGIMTPFWSMWLGNFIIGIIGIFLTLKANNESFNFPGADFISNLFSKLKSKFTRKTTIKA